MKKVNSILLICFLLEPSSGNRPRCTRCSDGSRKWALSHCSIDGSNADVTSLNRCPGVEHLILFNVTLPTLFVGNRLKTLQVEYCNTSEVVIDPMVDYLMDSLTVSNNSLVALPKNLNALKQLSSLILSMNRIECLDMTELNGLDKLKFLDLQDNNIFEICSSPFDPPVLPNLETIFLQRNKLETLSLEHWKTPKVKTLYIHGNELLIVHRLRESFPNLVTLYIYTNPLNCDWWNPLYAELERVGTKFAPEIKSTCDPNRSFLPNLIKKIEKSSNLPAPSSDQCKFNASTPTTTSLQEILKQVQQKVTSLGGAGAPTKTNQTITQLHHTCLGQQDKLKDIVKTGANQHHHVAKSDDEHSTESPDSTVAPPSRKNCRCGLRAQARVFRRQLEQIEQLVAKMVDGGRKWQG